MFRAVSHVIAESGVAARVLGSVSQNHQQRSEKAPLPTWMLSLCSGKTAPWHPPAHQPHPISGQEDART